MLFTDPFTPFVNQLNRTAVFMPPVEVTVSDGDLVITMDLPGLTADDLSIELLDGYLTVRGERTRPETSDGCRLVHTERTFGSFERRIKVPEGVDADRITASMDNGVLSLIVPKPDRMKPKTIPVVSGAGRPQLEAETVAA
jgi:HSP20 family protein